MACCQIMQKNLFRKEFWANSTIFISHLPDPEHCAASASCSPSALMVACRHFPVALWTSLPSAVWSHSWSPPPSPSPRQGDIWMGSSLWRPPRASGGAERSPDIPPTSAQASSRLGREREKKLFQTFHRKGVLVILSRRFYPNNNLQVPNICSVHVLYCTVRIDTF